MSGVFGYICDKNNYSNNDLDIIGMVRWNRLYGSKGEDVFKNEHIALGCCPDSLSENQVQKKPILSLKSLTAVIDAVIYNRSMIIEKCRAADDISDGELLLLYISLFGLLALGEVNGDFAGAVYDREKSKLTLFRDHMGVRPLYYYRDETIMAFSTDLRGLIALPAVKTDISEEWIYGNVSGYDVDTIDSTPYHRIRCVKPASYMTFSLCSDGISCDSAKYWKLGQKKIRLSSEKAYVDRMRNLVEDAIKIRLDAVSGTVGAELSGGLDSGVIDILIKRFGREGIFFSWSPDPNDIELGTEDERRIIADICEQENIHCYYSRLGEEYLDKVVKRAQDADIYVSEKGSIDFRFCLPESVNTFTLLKGSSFVKDKGARVMFTGHGGDEGISHRGNIYELFYHHEYYHYWRYLWCKTSKKPRILRTLKKGIKNIASSSKENREPYLNWFASPELLKSDISDKYRGKKYEKFLFDHDTIAYIESGGSRNRLDNMALLGAYTGIRYLIPYLDYRVIDYAVSIPRYLYTNEKSKRYIFREAFKDIMPMSLYKLNIKEDTSFRNMPQNPNWFQEFDRRKKEIVDNLDKEYWSKYLDYSKIEELYKKGEPSDEEYLEQSRQLKALLKCALAKNLLDVSKGRN